LKGSKMKKVDMSEAAILRRLKTVDRLRELCLSLMKAKKISDEKRAKEKSDAENFVQNTRGEQNRDS
jgi:hypothetical protein